jgi:hypothetical protein
MRSPRHATNQPDFAVNARDEPPMARVHKSTFLKLA